MATIYRTNDILHGCNDVKRIFNDALKIKESGRNYESYIFMVGCYASATGDYYLRSAWRTLRKLYNSGLDSNKLWYFKGIYNGCCCRLHYELGQFVWYNTLTFNY